MISSDFPHCIDCDKKCNLFKTLTKEELELIYSNKTEVRFKPGEIIIKQGTTLTHAVAFMEGLAKIYLEGFNYKDLILKLQKPTELIAGPGMYVDGRHHFSMAALTNCTACYIDINIVKQLVRQNGLFAEGFMTEFAKRTVERFGKIRSITQKQMHGRIADAILYLSESVYNSLSFDFVISRQDLADMTALTKESAIRILKQFEREGIINLKGNSIEILNINTLRNISRTG
jgi:CRP/FNR family transcriptional regulator, polysaccharide utilization system transcription regulator